MKNFIDVITHLNHFDYLVIGLNLTILLFSPIVAKWLPELGGSQTDNKRRIWTLRTLNIGMILLYLVSAAIGVALGKEIVFTGLTLMLGYLTNNLVSAWILRNFGKTRKLYDETEIHSETYQSEIFSLLATIFNAIAVILIVINIWQLNELLKATSVLGGLAIIIFATKDVWLPDNISGLMLLYGSDIEPGSIVNIPSENILGVALDMSLTKITFRDLVHGHRIIIRNSKIHNCKIEVLSKTSVRGLQRYVDFKIGYGHATEEIESLLHQAWEQACQHESAIDPEKAPRIYIAENGDHAVRWRIFFTVRSVYKMHQASYAINKAAYIVAAEKHIGLNTPLTHEVRSESAQENAIAGT